MACLDGTEVKLPVAVRFNRLHNRRIIQGAETLIFIQLLAWCIFEKARSYNLPIQCSHLIEIPNCKTTGDSVGH
jgi:hypothetical protein